MTDPRNVENFNHALKDMIFDVGNFIFIESQNQLIEDGKVDTGSLLKSGSIRRREAEVIIKFDAEHADIIEFGSFPGHTMNPEVLYDWIRRKLGVPEDQVKQTAYAIANTIKKRGIIASPYIRPSIRKADSKYGRK